MDLNTVMLISITSLYYTLPVLINVCNKEKRKLVGSSEPLSQADTLQAAIVSGMGVGWEGLNWDSGGMVRR
jgi:hypothetical protein